MKLIQRQKELGLTDRALAAKAGVSTATIYRAKRGGASRWGPMEAIAEALDMQVRDIDEFSAAIREHALREAERQGAPVAEIEVWTEGVLTGAYVPMGREAVQHGAYSLLRDTITYLDRAGRSDLVDKAIRDREERRRR